MGGLQTLCMCNHQDKCQVLCQRKGKNDTQYAQNTLGSNCIHNSTMMNCFPFFTKFGMDLEKATTSKHRHTLFEICLSSQMIHYHFKTRVKYIQAYKVILYKYDRNCKGLYFTCIEYHLFLFKVYCKHL